MLPKLKHHRWEFVYKEISHRGKKILHKVNHCVDCGLISYSIAGGNVAWVYRNGAYHETPQTQGSPSCAP